MKIFRFCAVLTAVLFNVLFIGRTQAASVDSKMFSASGIQIDVTAENAASAREQAMQDGQKRALMVVMARITPAYAAEQLPELVPDDILNFVQDISVSNEKTSAVRYMATLDVRFNPEAVRELLRQNGLPYVRTSGKLLLILPIYKRSASATPILWEEENAWLRAWINRKAESYMIPLFVPLGELSDAQTLSVDQILRGDLVAAQELAKRYEAEGILIAELVRNGQTFTVKGRAMDEATASEIPNFSFSVPLTKNTATTFARAVAKVVDHLESVWKSEQMVQFNEAASLVAMVPVVNLKQWEIIKERLDRIPLISSYYLQAARSGVLQLTVFFAESMERLQKEMNKRMLSLTALPSGVFKLTTAEQMSYLPLGEGVSSFNDKEEASIMPVAEEKAKPENRKEK
ncbi:MAG: DUF2066 domain-containing protein [Alphaproteobacteria bacterium]|nr:DUF2066 domain-containing protein [Alphaproteobacteria bacterium]MBO4644546.1 DUF2066 domain-containing protein [Alphaproteobacteria bacterium]